MDLRWALFDLNGTLLDPGGVGEPLGLSREQSNSALDDAILAAMADTLSGGYRPLPDLLRAALLRRAGTDSGLDEAMTRARHMPAFPDSGPALDRLRAAGIETGVLTNSPRAAAEEALEAAGLRARLSLVAGTDAVEAFKPDQRVYRLGLEHAGARSAEVCMIAAHWWDLMGASRAGLRTGFVEREGRTRMPVEPAPDLEAPDLVQQRRAADRGLIIVPQMGPHSGSDAVTRISQAYPDRVEVRGRDLCGEVMGTLGFTEYFHLLLTGREPTEDQRFFLDLLLVAIAEHGMMPTNVAARMTLSADPDSLQGAVAAGILGCGPVILGTAEACARLLEEAQQRMGSGVPADRVAGELARELHASGRRLPGFGHPVHRPLDPRAERILELADARGVSGHAVTLARQFRDAAAEIWGRPLTMNVSMPIAAVMLDLGFPADVVKSVPILARTAGLLAHLAEERQDPIGFRMAAHAEEAVEYVGPPDEPAK